MAIPNQEQHKLTWSEILEIGVDNFFDFPFCVKLTTLVIPIGLLFIILGISINSWSHSDSDNIGLWKYCSTFSYIECCESITDFLGREPPDWIEATKVFQIMALAPALGCGIGAIVTMCVNSCKNNITINKIICFFFLSTALLLIISVGVYSNNYHTEDWLKDHQLSVAFVLTATALILYGLGGIALLIMICRGNIKVHNSDMPEKEPRPNPSTPEYSILTNRPIRMPSLWTHYDNSKHIDDWTRNAADVKLVAVSGKERKAIEDLVQKTWRRDLVGIGKDATGLDSLPYNSIIVTQIERAENPKLFQKYAQDREALFNKVGSRNASFQGLENTKPARSGEVMTSTYLDRTVFSDIRPDLNEHYLFHGTYVQYVDAIVEQGLDARLNNHGSYGKAVYAAESSTKSDCYADPKRKRDMITEKKMILLRMLLGDVLVLKKRKVYTRPPCKACYSDRCSDKSHSNMGDWYYDSVVVDGKWNFREFLVFEMSKCYPEYVISYKRVQAN